MSKKTTYGDGNFRRPACALFVLLMLALKSHGGIIITGGTPIDVGHGLYAITVRAISDDPANQTINGIASPRVVALGGGGGPHQVWLNDSGLFTSPTKADQLPGLWNDAYTPFDSHWLFDTNNSLAIGAPFNESNDGTGGISGLPANPLGAAYTGFGAMGTVGNAAGSRAFTIASGKQGTSVDLAYLVLKLGTVARLTGIILTNQGNNQAVDAIVPPFSPNFPEPSSFALLFIAAISANTTWRRRC